MHAGACARIPVRGIQIAHFLFCSFVQQDVCLLFILRPSPADILIVYPKSCGASEHKLISKFNYTLVNEEVWLFKDLTPPAVLGVISLPTVGECVAWVFHVRLGRYGALAEIYRGETGN